MNTASFIPFGKDYRGGVSLATGWLAGSLGGAKRIIVSQLADSGSVKIFSSGSALDGGPSLYLHSPLHHDHGAHFREIASFEPFDGSAGTRVATTSTTTGANLLVSGVAAGGTDASVLKYDFVRPNAQSTTLQAVRLGQVWSGKGVAACHPRRRLNLHCATGLLIEVLRTNMLAASLSLHDPEPDVRRLLFNHLVGTQQDDSEIVRPQRLRRLKIDRKLKLFADCTGSSPGLVHLVLCPMVAARRYMSGKSEP